LLFLYIFDQIFDNRNNISSALPGNPVSFRHNFGGLHFELGLTGKRYIQFLMPPGQKSHGQPFFLLSEKAHTPAPLSAKKIFKSAGPEHRAVAFLLLATGFWPLVTCCYLLAAGTGPLLFGHQHKASGDRTLKKSLFEKGASSQKPEARSQPPVALI